jgi:hypothetical protein
VFLIRVPFSALFSVLLATSLLNLLPPGNWLLELNQNLGGYYLLMHFLLVPFGILLAVWFDRAEEIGMIIVINMLMIAYYAVPVVPLMFFNPVPEGDLSCDRRLTTTFIQANNSREVTEMSTLLESLHPEIVFLAAGGVEPEKAIELLAGYKHIRKTAGVGRTELVIASQVPLGEVLAADLGDDLKGALIVELLGERVPKAALGLVVGVDPLGESELNNNTLIMRRSSAALRSLRMPSLTATSLRMTPHSKLYSVFKEENAFQDLFSGMGLVRTWSGRSPFIRFHYDQLFIRGRLLASDVATVRSTIFDHQPVIAAVRFCS